MPDDKRQSVGESRYILFVDYSQTSHVLYYNLARDQEEVSHIYTHVHIHTHHTRIHIFVYFNEISESTD